VSKYGQSKRALSHPKLDKVPLKKKIAFRKNGQEPAVDGASEKSGDNG